jgi:hypothetical protein
MKVRKKGMELQWERAFFVEKNKISGIRLRKILLAATMRTRCVLYTHLRMPGFSSGNNGVSL